MSELCKTSSCAADELTPMSIRIAREAAKQVYASSETSSALEKMIRISQQSTEDEQMKVSELVARWVQSTRVYRTESSVKEALRAAL